MLSLPFYFFVRKLEGMGKTDLKAVFVDGTKLESRAGRYTLSGGEAAGPSKGKMKTLTGLSTSDAVRSQLNEEAKGIEFISGKGKSQTQRTWEEKQVLLERWERYEEMLSIKGGRAQHLFQNRPGRYFFHGKENLPQNFSILRQVLRFLCFPMAWFVLLLLRMRLTICAFP